MYMKLCSRDNKSESPCSLLLLIVHFLLSLPWLYIHIYNQLQRSKAAEPRRRSPKIMKSVVLALWKMNEEWLDFVIQYMTEKLDMTRIFQFISHEVSTVCDGYVGHDRGVGHLQQSRTEPHRPHSNPAQDSLNQLRPFQNSHSSIVEHGCC